MTNTGLGSNERALSARKLVLLLLASLLVVPVAATLLVATEDPAGAANAQYPDLGTLPPRDLRFDTATIGGTPHQVLRFSNTVLNEGEGKLDVFSPINPATLSGPAEQRVYDDVGNYAPYPIGSFTWHAVHSHFHFDNWGAYELWTKADYDEWIASGRSPAQADIWKLGSKTTSCVLDEEFIATLPGTPYPAVYNGAGCLLLPDNTLHQGLSPGWGDTYDWYRDEQWIDLDQTPLGNGTYVLRSVTDPNNAIYESPGRADTSRESQQDNEATTTFTVSGGFIVDSAVPGGTVSINDVDTVTSNRNVTVKVIGRDDVSGVDAFRLSNDGTTWATYAYASSGSSPTSVSWDLADSQYGGSTTPGTKTVYARVRDVAGNWSPTFTDTITLLSQDPTPPASVYGLSVFGDGPSGYWRLGEASGSVAADVMGANPGTYLNGPTRGQASLVTSDPLDTAVGFDGVNDAVRVPDSASLDMTTALSLEAWIRPNALPSSGQFASVLSKPEAYSIQFNGSRLEFTVIQSGVRRRLQAPVGAVAAGQTYHVVGTYDGATQRLYLNGTQVAVTGLTGAATGTTASLHVGSWDGNGEFFNGRIDEPAAYAKALTAANVTTHYTAALGTAPVTYPVTVTTSGNGSGTVTSAPAGISCGSTCAASFSVGSNVTLSATAAQGSTFVGWSGGTCSGTAPACTVTVSGATAVTATFQLSTVLSPYGLAVFGDGPTGYWRLGEATGSVAADVMGANAGTYVNGATLGQPSLVSSDPVDTAVALDGTNDHVRVPDSASLDYTTALSLEAWIRPAALPSSGQFASVVSKPEAYSLQFNGPRLELTIIQSGVRRRLQAPVGAVAVGQTYHVVATYDGATQRIYLNGSQVAVGTLTGAATRTTTNLHVGAWDGAGENFNGRIDEAATYGSALTATTIATHYATGLGGAPVTYPVTVTKSGSGSGTVGSSPAGISCGTTCSAPFPASQPVTLTATAAAGSTFVGWSGGACSGTAPSCTFSPYAATGVTATFQLVSSAYTLSVSKSGGGTGTVASAPAGITCGAICTGTFTAGSTVTLTATPAAGSVFASWGGACAGTSATCTVTMSAAQSVDAAFVPLYAVTVTKSGNGSGAVVSSPAGINCGVACSASFSVGSNVTLTATPTQGSTFTGWSGGACSGTAPTCTVTVSGAIGVTATFQITTSSAYAAAVSADGPAGYWRLGETTGSAAASVTGTNGGTYVNGVTLGQASLVPSDPANTAVGFNGSNSHVRVLDAASLDMTNKVTLEAWIRPNALPASGQFASVLSKPEAYSIQFNGPRLEFTIMQSGVRRRLQAPVGAVAVGQTYHVVATFDGATQRLYIGGIQVAVTTLTGTATSTNTNLHIGAWDGAGENFNGRIDEAAVYAKALTASAIATHHAAGLGS